MFGISLPHFLPDPVNFIRNLDSRLIHFLELQGTLVSEPKVIDAILAKGIYPLNSYDYIKKSTITNSLEQSDIFQYDVLRTIELLLSEKSYIMLGNVTIDLGILREGIDPGESEKIINFVKKLYFRILSSSKNICLPIVLPGMESDLTIIQKLFYKLMLNRFKICLNIYPHDIKKGDDFEDFIHNLSFRLELIRLCYDASSGNYISEKLLNYWMEIFKRYDINCPIIFVPSVNSTEMLELEMNNIYELLSHKG